MADNLTENLAGTTLSLTQDCLPLTDDCLRAVCFHLDRLENIRSFSNVCQRFRQAARYRLSRMSLTICVHKRGCNCKDEDVEEVHTDREWKYVVRDARNTVSVNHPLTIQHNEALVQGIHRIQLSQSICLTENEEQFVTLRKTLNHFTAVTEFWWISDLIFCNNMRQFYLERVLNIHLCELSHLCCTLPMKQNSSSRGRSQACAGRSPAAVLFDLCEPFFQQLLVFKIFPFGFKFDGSDLELLCNVLCAMPKLVDVSIAKGISCDSFIKLSQILQGKGTSALNVLSAFTRIKYDDFHRDGTTTGITDLVAAVSEYPNLVELDISYIGCPPPNNRVDLTPLQNLTKLKMLRLTASGDLGLIYVIPSQLTVVNLVLLQLACRSLSVAGQLLKACQSLSVLKLCQPCFSDYHIEARLGSCTFAEFLRNFEIHTNLTKLEVEHRGPWTLSERFPDEHEHEHFRSHCMELTLRAPICLKHLHFSLSPHERWTAEEEMHHWASVVKVARTQTLHITSGVKFEDSLSEQLATAMQQSEVKELFVDAECDIMQRAANGTPLHCASVVTGPRPGNDVPFRIEFLNGRPCSDASIVT